MKNAFKGVVLLCSLLFAALDWLTMLVLRLLLIVLGAPVVALAAFFPVAGVSASDGRPIVNLPRWAWLFGNDYDGLDGDKRKWWADNCDALVFFGLLPFLRRLGLPIAPLPVTSWLARWWWAAVRNPVNNMRLLSLFSCPVSECQIGCLGDLVVEDRPGYAGWQFVSARRTRWGRHWYGLYVVWQWRADRAFVLRLGFKIKPEHEGSAEPAKGMTFKVNPWKAI